MKSAHRSGQDNSQDTAKISRDELDAVLNRQARRASGVRPAVRPVVGKTTASGAAKPVHRLASSSFTTEEEPTRPVGARPAAIEVTPQSDSESDRLAEEMFRAVERARTSAQSVGQTTAHMPAVTVAALVATCSTESLAVDARAASTAMDDELIQELEAIDELTRERTRALGTVVSLALLVAVLTTVAWYADRVFAPLLH